MRIFGRVENVLAIHPARVHPLRTSSAIQRPDRMAGISEGGSAGGLVDARCWDSVVSGIARNILVAIAPLLNVRYWRKADIGKIVTAHQRTADSVDF